METKQRWQDWVNLALAVWLFISPFVGIVAVGSMAAWDGYIFAVIIAALSVWALIQPRAWEEWINLILGIWLIISPFVLGFSAETVVMWNFVIVGIIVGADALWAALTKSGPSQMQHV